MRPVDVGAWPAAIASVGVGALGLPEVDARSRTGADQLVGELDTGARRPLPVRRRLPLI